MNPAAEQPPLPPLLAGNSLTNERRRGWEFYNEALWEISEGEERLQELKKLGGGGPGVEERVAEINRRIQHHVDSIANQECVEIYSTAEMIALTIVKKKYNFRGSVNSPTGLHNALDYLDIQNMCAQLKIKYTRPLMRFDPTD